MAKVQVRCTNFSCTAQYTVDETVLNKTGTCKVCGKTFKLVRAEAAPVVRRAAPARSAERPRGADGIPHEWELGDVILNLYEVRPLSEGKAHAQGGMGRVNRIWHREWKVDLAVKSVLPEKLKSPAAVDNFKKEAEEWVNKIGLHPHVVSCFYVRVLGGLPRVFIELVEGGNLREWIDSGKLYEGGPEETLRRILDVAIQFAWGLHYVHELGMIHQDVKPANVMMTAGGIAKVTDFGIARAREAAGDNTSEGRSGQTLLVPGAGLITREYASPEQLDKQPLTRRTDLWSWAVSVLQMFTTEFPNVGPAAPVLLERSLQEKDSAGLLPAIPESVVKLLRRCFQRNPEGRPHDMLQVADSLREIYQQLIGHRYPREMPRVAEAMADTLNNRAVSLLDLGKPEEALKLWDEALKADPQHLQTTYNSGLVRWRKATVNDDALLANMRAVVQSRPDEWLPVWMLANIHLERGDCEAALEVLGQVTDTGAEREEIRVLRKQAEELQPGSRRCLRSFEADSDVVTSVCLSGDGRFALSASYDKTLKLWEVSTGRCLRSFEGHTDEVNAVCLSGDGRFALSASRELKLWEVPTGRCLRSFEGHIDVVKAVCLSGDGRFALSGSLDETVKLWEVSTGRCLHSLGDHRSHVYSACLSGDGCFALSGSRDRKLKLWEVSTGRCLRTFEGHTKGVTSVSLSGDGRFALSGSEDKTLRLWEVSSGRCLRSFQGHTGGVTSVSLSGDGRFALSGSKDETLRLWEVPTGRCLHTFEGHTSNVSFVSLSRDGRFAFSGSEGGFVLSGSREETLKLWEVALAWSKIAPLHLSHLVTADVAASARDAFEKELAQGLEALANSMWNLAAAHLGRARKAKGHEFHPQILQAWPELYVHLPRGQFRTGKLKHTVTEDTEVTCVCLSGDGRFALSGHARFPLSERCELKLWEVSTGRRFRSFSEHTDRVTSACLSGDGRFALSGSWDKTLKLWKVSTGRCLCTFKGHRALVESVCLSEDSRFALSGSEDKTLKLWEMSTSRCLRTFKGHTESVVSVCLSGDGRFALSGSYDDTLKLWEVVTGRCLRSFEGHTDGVTSVCLSGDGRFALSGSFDKALKLWEMSTGHCLRSFEGHTGGVTSVSLSGDGRFALSGSADKTLKLWEVSSGHCLYTFEGHTSEVTSVSLSGDGRFALSGSEDKTQKLWSLDWDLEIREPADWDEGARPYLDSFLARHTPYLAPSSQEPEDFPGSDADHGPGHSDLALTSQEPTPTEAELTSALTRQGKPSWTEDDFQQFLYALGCAGYGWLRPEGVRLELEKSASPGQKPPPVPGSRRGWFNWLFGNK